MENNKIVKSIINVCTRLENLCEGFDVDSKSMLISSKLKILLAVKEQEKVSPSMLINKIGLAKSNIALLCKNMVQENLLEKQKDEFDSRVIFYTITNEGEKMLNTSLEQMSFNFKRELAYKQKFKEIEQTLDLLKDLID